MSESQIPKKPSCTDKNQKDNQSDNSASSNTNSKQSITNKLEEQTQVIQFW